MRATVEQVMVRPAAVISAGAGFKAAVVRLCAHWTTALTVIDRDGRVVGLVSDEDLVRKEERGHLEGRPPLLRSRAHRRALRKAAGRTVDDVMTSPAAMVRPDTPVDGAVRIMREHGVRALVVVDGERRPLGVVSCSDLLEVFLRADEELHREVMEDLVVRQLGIDPTSVRLRVEEGVVAIKGRVERRSDATTLERVIPRMDGVVDVDAQLTYRFDDTAPQAEWQSLRPAPPW
jgi:CBS domain-containing protein